MRADRLAGLRKNQDSGKQWTLSDALYHASNTRQGLDR
jgi:hypothetical protein